MATFIFQETSKSFLKNSFCQLWPVRSYGKVLDRVMSSFTNTNASFLSVFSTVFGRYDNYFICYRFYKLLWHRFMPLWHCFRLLWDYFRLFWNLFRLLWHLYTPLWHSFKLLGLRFWLLKHPFWVSYHLISWCGSIFGYSSIVLTIMTFFPFYYFFPKIVSNTVPDIQITEGNFMEKSF